MTTTYSEVQRTADGGWFRKELTDDLPAVVVMVAGPNDGTYGMPVSYDARCAACWLGHAHSPLIHRLCINRTLGL